MAITKREIAEDPHSAWNKAHADEPLFIIRGQDMIGAGLVRNWAKNAKARGAAPARTQEAMEIAEAMERWPNRKWPD
jgi:hypothetical protein